MYDDIQTAYDFIMLDVNCVKKISFDTPIVQHIYYVPKRVKDLRLWSSWRLLLSKYQMLKNCPQNELFWIRYDARSNSAQQLLSDDEFRNLYDLN
jgi:hypothetical protein